MRKQRTRGQALVEMAFVLPIFIIIIVGIFDFGRVLHCWATLNYQCVRAARTSTRRINPLLTGNAMIPSAFPTLAETASTFNQYRSPMMSPANYVDQSSTSYQATDGTTVTIPVYFSHSGITNYDPTDPEKNKVVKIKASYTLDMITPLLGQLVGGENRPGSITIHAYAEEHKE